MKTLISVSFYILLLSVISCSTSTEPDEPIYNWEKIEIQDEGTVYSFYGGLDDFVLIGTSGSILKSTDSGENWRKVYSVPYYVRQFIQKADTIFALAGHEDYFSLDGGESWEKSANVKKYDKVNKVTSLSGIKYQLEPQFQGTLAQPTLVLESKNGENWKEIFPFNHYIYSIHIDNNDRLYLGINGWEWDEERNSFDPNSNNNAIIYYTKN